MAALEELTCDHCGTPFWVPEVGEDQNRPTTCAVCEKLGDRSLLWYFRAVKAQVPGRARRFAEARGRSTIHFKQGREALR